MGSLYLAQADSLVLGSSDSLVLASQSTGIPGVRHCAWPPEVLSMLQRCDEEGNSNSSYPECLVVIGMEKVKIFNFGCQK